MMALVSNFAVCNFAQGLLASRKVGEPISPNSLILLWHRAEGAEHLRDSSVSLTTSSYLLRVTSLLTLHE